MDADIGDRHSRRHARHWAAFGPGEAARGANQAPSDVRPTHEHADYKVLIWYRRADPLATFHYQVYDVRRGEFSAAVVAWIKNVDAKYPAYIAYSRDVNLGVEEGKTDSLKVGAVIKRELTVAAALSGVMLGSPINSRGRPFESLRNAGTGTNRHSGPLSSDRSFLQARPAPFPVPMPYPRPHP